MTQFIMIVETLGAEIAKTLVEKIAAVGLKKIYKDFKADYEQHLVPLTKHFEEYLTRAYERHSVVSTLVLRNSKRRLKDIYVPLTILEENNSEEKNILFYPIGCQKVIKYKGNKQMFSNMKEFKDCSSHSTTLKNYSTAKPANNNKK